MYIYRGIFKNRAKKPTARQIGRGMYLKTTTEKYMFNICGKPRIKFNFLIMNQLNSQFYGSFT